MCIACYNDYVRNNKIRFYNRDYTLCKSESRLIRRTKNTAICLYMRMELKRGLAQEMNMYPNQDSQHTKVKENNCRANFYRRPLFF